MLAVLTVPSFGCESDLESCMQLSLSNRYSARREPASASAAVQRSDVTVHATEPKPGQRMTRWQLHNHFLVHAILFIWLQQNGPACLLRPVKRSLAHTPVSTVRAVKYARLGTTLKSKTLVGSEL